MAPVDACLPAAIAYCCLLLLLLLLHQVKWQQNRRANST
jgi:hypothetical protein